LNNRRPLQTKINAYSEREGEEETLHRRGRGRVMTRIATFKKGISLKKKRGRNLHCLETKPNALTCGRKKRRHFDLRKGRKGGKRENRCRARDARKRPPERHCGGEREDRKEERKKNVSRARKKKVRKKPPRSLFEKKGPISRGI